MKIVLRLIWVYILLISRVPLSLFFNVVLPLAFFVFYAGVLAGATGPAISTLVVRLVVLGALSNGLFGLSIALVIMRERDILRRYHLAPISAFHVVISRLIANYLLFLAVVVLELVMCQTLLKLDVGGVFLQVLLIFSLGYLAIAAIGFVIAAIVNNVNDAQVWNQLTFFGLLFLSGVAVPLAVMPRALQQLSAFIPPALTVVAANVVLVQKAPLTTVWPEMAALAVMTFVSLGVATVMFRWEKEARVTARERLQAAVILVPLLVTGVLLNASDAFLHRVTVTAPPPASTMRR
jgi:ABC-2 type transport system permease protein